MMQPAATGRKKRVMVLHTGGTIGMRWDDDKKAYKTAPGHLEKQMRQMKELHHPKMPEYYLSEVDTLLDSSVMTPDHWNGIASRIKKNLQNYDGFVVLHGTDTMAYTASALSFLLPFIDRPIIVTGAQIPMAEPRNDAQNHLITSLMLAGTDGEKLPEVCLYFHGSVMRGNRASKVDADGYDAFDSPNMEDLVSVGVKFEHHSRRILPPTGAEGPPSPKVRKKMVMEEPAPPKRFCVASFRVYPGVDPAPLARMIPDDGPDGFGLLLELFGAGNGPEDRLRPVIEDAVKKGVVVVATTQCLRGTVRSLYAAGSWLKEVGVVSGLDMTPEAAMAKLHVLLQRFPFRDQAKEVRDRMARNLRGELSAVYKPEFLEDFYN